MDIHGRVRVATAIPVLRLANPRANVDAILELLSQASRDRGEVVAFPELCLTGYTCGDLFAQSTLIDAARQELERLARESANVFAGLVVVGLPWARGSSLYNVAAVIQAGRILGLVPKSYLPNYNEFYEQRWFTPAHGPAGQTERIGDREVPFGTDVLFQQQDAPDVRIGVEICEDLWSPIPPSCRQALAGATILVNLSASNEAIGKSDYRRALVVQQSARCIAAYLYAGAGVAESTTDLVFGGHGLIAENGQLLVDGVRFSREPELRVADVDIERLTGDRRRMRTFFDPAVAAERHFRLVAFDGASCADRGRPMRPIDPHPFVPSDPAALADRCHEIFQIQTAALARRLETVKPPAAVIGVSGGLDSTLALLVAAKTVDQLGWDRKSIHGVTMPGFGTSQRTRANAEALMAALAISTESIDIRPLCLQTFVELNHQPFGVDPKGKTVDEFVAALANADHDGGDLLFENVQARTRTLLLMSRGFVIGTGDLSELALGWSTYNADHMSMYNPNASIPKTLVRFLVRWVADHEFADAERRVLHSIADTEISPELLPLGPGEALQSTEGTIGPYELHDFFLYHFVRFGFRPSKVLHLARHATFDRDYAPAEQRRWLEVFLRRFFASQYKRSCIPDGPKVGAISLSPRGDWRMPSDAQVAAWIEELAASAAN